jgi:hypothetical protein
MELYDEGIVAACSQISSLKLLEWFFIKFDFGIYIKTAWRISISSCWSNICLISNLHKFKINFIDFLKDGSSNRKLIYYVKHRSRWIVQPLHETLFNEIWQVFGHLLVCNIVSVVMTGLAILRSYLRWRLYVPNKGTSRPVKYTKPRRTHSKNTNSENYNTVTCISVAREQPGKHVTARKISWPTMLGNEQ